MESLGKQAIQGVKWSALKTAVGGIVGPITLIIKARYLSPEDFGYLAIILIVIGLFRLLESFGISQAIIQRDAVSSKESSSLFFFNILLSFALAAALFAAAPLLSLAFGLAELTEYLRLACLVVLVTGPALLFQAFLEKSMCFRQLALIGIASQFFMLVGTFVLLELGFGLWAVVYAHVAGSLLTTVLIVFVALRRRLVRVTLYFSPRALGPFLRFGVFVSAKQLLTFAAHRLDEVLIGLFLTPEILGFYHFGKSMLEKLRSLMTASFSKVLYPVLSKLKHQPKKLALAYQRISRYIAFAAFPVFGGIAATAHLFVPIVFGEQWTDSVIVFQVFSVAVILLALTANVATSLLYAVNRPALVFHIDLVTNALYFASLFLLASRGMVAVLLVYSAYVIYKTLTLQFFANRQLGEGYGRYVSVLAAPAGAALMMLAAVLAFQWLGAGLLGNAALLAGSIAIGALVYGLMAMIVARETVEQLKQAMFKGEIAA